MLSLFNCKHFSVLTDDFNGINELVAVHATMILSMHVQSYLNDASLAASLSPRTHTLILLAQESFSRRATHGKQLTLHSTCHKRG